MGSDHSSDGPTGVSTFLAQIEPTLVEQERAPAESVVDKTSVDKPKVERKASGGLRGLLRRATSLRSSKRSSKEEPDLEPVLVMTDENRGKVVFPRLEGEDMDAVNLCVDTNLHASIPDMCMLSTSNSSRSTECSSSTDSPVSASKPLHNSLQAPERKSDTSSPDKAFYVDLEQQPPPAPEPQPASPKGFRGRLRTFFKRTKSGRTVTEGSSRRRTACLCAPAAGHRYGE